MRIGQTALITFASNSVASVIGFLGTIYFARALGAEVLGVYSLVLALVAWIAIVGDAGVAGAIGKRLSEGHGDGEFFAAGMLLISTFYVVVSVVLLSFRDLVEGYVGFPVIGLVILILLVNLLSGAVNATLTGYHLVHVQGILNPVRIAIRTFLQIAFVFLGFRLVGLLGGYVIGYFVVALVGLWIASPAVSVPAQRHFRSLFSYAQYSWLGAVQTRTFGWVDVIVLGFFVSSNLIGVYSVGWTISTFLLASGSAISSAIFPEISRIVAEEGTDAAVPVVRDAMTYAGVFLIPGLVGSVILGDRILMIYGPEFTQGAAVLAVLIVACLIYGYLRQLVSTMNAIDRPDHAFKVYVVFIVANVLLNVGLVYLIGWLGAAIATVLSAGLALIVAYYYVSRLIEISAPIEEFGKQWISASVMGVAVSAGLWMENSFKLLSHNAGVVIVLVTAGGGIYFLTLYGISERFRRIVRDNVPFEIPTMS